MRIETIRLVNFRGFADFSIDLHPEVTLLVGENGSGKTALIDGLALALGQLYSPLGLKALRPGRHDVRRKLFVHGEVPDLQPQLPAALTYEFSWGEDTFCVEASLAENGWASFGREWNAATQRARAVARQLKQGQPVDLPLLVRVPAARQWARAPSVKELPAATRADGYGAWHQPSANHSQLTTWLRDYTMAELQEQTTVPQLAAIQNTVRHLVPGADGIEYRWKAKELRLRFDGGKRILAFRELSDGYRNIVALAADIAWRCAVLNPHLGEQATTETQGVVLIDELELHLHPRWQRQVLPALHAAFPRLQIIATTHSPQVLGSAKREWIRVLRADGSGANSDVAATLGRDSNAILTDVMGTAERDPETQQRLDALFEAIDANDRAEARRLNDELESALGHDDAELVRARWALEMATDGGDDSEG